MSENFANRWQIIVKKATTKTQVQMDSKSDLHEMHVQLQAIYSVEASFFPPQHSFSILLFCL